MLHRIIFAAFEEIAHVGPGFVNSWLLGLEVVLYLLGCFKQKSLKDLGIRNQLWDYL